VYPCSHFGLTLIPELSRSAPHRGRRRRSW
jgi:hypothetical protein